MIQLGLPRSCCGIICPKIDMCLIMFSAGPTKNNFDVPSLLNLNPGASLPLYSLIFEKSTAVPDMAPDPYYTTVLYGPLWDFHLFLDEVLFFFSGLMAGPTYQLPTSLQSGILIPTPLVFSLGGLLKVPILSPDPDRNWCFFFEIP
jgi:hypothetical protein